MNIILNEDYTLKTTKMDNKSKYDLSDINIYIPKSLNNTDCFLYLIDEIGMSDIVPLEYFEDCLNHKKYKITYHNAIRINSGKVLIKLVLINSQNNSTSISVGNDIVCDLKIDNYAICHQISMIKELNSAILDIYNKINELTKMNIDIYEKIVEVSKL